jgi:hypothetical protein
MYSFHAARSVGGRGAVGCGAERFGISVGCSVDARVLQGQCPCERGGAIVRARNCDKALDVPSRDVRRASRDVTRRAEHLRACARARRGGRASVMVLAVANVVAIAACRHARRIASSVEVAARSIGSRV